MDGVLMCSCIWETYTLGLYTVWETPRAKVHCGMPSDISPMSMISIIIMGASSSARLGVGDCLSRARLG